VTGELDRWRAAVQRNDRIQEQTMTATKTSAENTHVAQPPTPEPPHPAWCDRTLCEVEYLTSSVGEWTGHHVGGPPTVVELTNGGQVSTQLRQFYTDEPPVIELRVNDYGQAGVMIPADGIGPVLAALGTAAASYWDSAAL
jgi:hypothetical protein